MEGDQLMFDLDQGFAQGFTQEQVDGKFYNELFVYTINWNKDGRAQECVTTYYYFFLIMYYIEVFC